MAGKYRKSRLRSLILVLCLGLQTPLAIEESSCRSTISWSVQPRLTLSKADCSGHLSTFALFRRLHSSISGLSQCSSTSLVIMSSPRPTLSLPREFGERSRHSSVCPSTSFHVDLSSILPPLRLLILPNIDYHRRIAIIEAAIYRTDTVDPEFDYEGLKRHTR
jgi:hypothetical protein